MNAGVTLPELHSLMPHVARRLARASHAQEAKDLIQEDRLWGLPGRFFFAGSESVFRDELRAGMADWLAAARRHEAMRQSLILRAFIPILEACRARGVEVLVLKGLAYGLRFYDELHARPWRDIDILIDEDDLDEVEAIFTEAGWRRPYGMRGRVVSHQVTWQRELAGGVEANIDVHWRLSNRQRFARLVGSDELWRESVDMWGALCSLRSSAGLSGVHEDANAGLSGVHALSNFHALLHALFHLASHHAGEEWPAIWHLDLRLLHDALNEADARKFLSLIRRMNAEPLCREVAFRHLDEAGASLPLLQMAVAEESDAGVLRARLTKVSWWQEHRAVQLALDLWSLNTAPLRIRYLREVLFPPESSLRAGMHDTSSPLWLLHAKRLLWGGSRRSRAESREEER